MEICAQNSLDLREKEVSTSGVLFYRTFCDIDELASFLPEKVRITQLSPGPFRCHTCALIFEKIQFNFNRLDRPLYGIGEKLPDYLSFVCLPHPRQGNVISHGRSITEDCLYGFDTERGIDMVFSADTLHCSVHVRREVFQDCIEAMERTDINTTFFSPNCVHIPETLPPLRNYLRQLYELLQQRSPLLENPDFAQIILKDFLPLLVMALPLQSDRLKTVPKSFARRQLVKRTEDYMRANLDRPLTLTDLCKALDTSERALCYGFKEIFGTSPMAYLKILRLHGAYRALKVSSPELVTITGIAHRFGFWSPGHFARDYRVMFGELPRETLTK